MTPELPKDNLDLIPWAKANGYPLPEDHEFYDQYRERLEAEIRKRTSPHIQATLDDLTRSI